MELRSIKRQTGSWISRIQATLKQALSASLLEREPVSLGFTLMANPLVPLLLIATLAGCSGLSALTSLASGGGTNVAANTQIGRENRQAAVSVEERVEAGRDVIQKEVEAGPVDNLIVNNEEYPPWLLLVALIGWLLPTPTQMGQVIGRALMMPFRRKK